MSLASKRGRNAAFLVGLLLISWNEATARVFQVGGSEGWTVPLDPSAQPYNQWAEKNRFQIGDSLRFFYKAGSDSVLQVSKDDYTNCNTAAPIAFFTDGLTIFTFNQSGPYYFISGVDGNCKNNEKLHIIVMADRTKKPPTQPPVSPPAASPPSTPSPAASPPATSPPVESPPAPSGASAPAPEASSPPATPPTAEVPPSGNGVSSLKTSSKLATIVTVFLGPLFLSVM